MNYKVRNLIITAKNIELKHLKKYATLNANDVKEKVKNDLETALANASKVQSSGIMPFTKMLDIDQVSLTFDVNRNDSFGVRNIYANNLILKSNDPSRNVQQLIPKYEPLLEQVAKYLTKNWEIFPSSILSGPLAYDDFSVKLEF